MTFTDRSKSFGQRSPSVEIEEEIEERYKKLPFGIENTNMKTELPPNDELQRRAQSDLGNLDEERPRITSLRFPERRS